MRTSKWSVVVATLTIGAFAAACGGGDQGEQAETAQPEASAAAPATSDTNQMASAAGQGPEIGQIPEGATMEMVEEGGKIFHGQGNCYTCHGMDAKGTQLAPNQTDQEWINIDGSYESIIQTVKTGVPTPKQHPAPMPPMGGAQLTDQQVKDVAAYIYAISHPKQG